MAGGRPVRRRWGAPVAVAGAVAVAAASFLPLATSGSATRSSYEVVRAAERLDVVTGPAAVAARAWFLVPLLAGVAWLAAARGARPVLAVACVTLCGSSCALAVAVLGSPLEPTAGAVMLPLAGLVALLGTARQAWERRRPWTTS